jgi:hypothetical protein
MRPKLASLQCLGLCVGLLASVLALGPALGCAKQLQVDTEYVEGTDFAKYQTYRWITEDLVLIQSGTGNERIRNVENEQRIRAAVERELEAKGLRKAGEEADLIVAFTVGTKVRYRIQGGNNYDIVTDPAAQYTRGVLSIYMFDRESQQQIWSGRTQKDLQPGDNPDAVINTAVDVLLAHFPPKK